MNDDLAITVLLELLNRAPKNQAELAGAEAAIKHIKGKFDELAALKAEPKPAGD